MTEGLRSIVPLGKDSMRGITPASLADEKPPQFEWVDPKEIFVEEAYQRDLSEGSIGLIRRIIAGWSWARFKTPICVRIEEWDRVLVCIDGQHTAIAAASHPGIDRIPVMIVDGASRADRAHSFVGHNRDRIALTQMAIFYAELASGDPIAGMIERACKTAGASILKKPVNARRQTEPGMTMAVGTLRHVAGDHGEAFVARVLGILTRAGRGPIKADEISAVTTILSRTEGLDDRLEKVVAGKTAQQWAAIGVAKTAAHGGKLTDALATLWCREMDVRLPPKPPKPQPAPKPVVKKVQVKAQKVQVAPAPKPRMPTMADRIARLKAAQAKAAPPAAPKPAPPLPKATPKPAVAPVPPRPQPAPVSNVVQHGQIIVDTGLGTVRRGDFRAETSPDGARLLALLAKVRPAFLEAADLIQKLGMDSFRLRALVGRVNGDIAKTGLMIKNVMKTGWMLGDLD